MLSKGILFLRVRLTNIYLSLWLAGLGNLSLNVWG